MEQQEMKKEKVYQKFPDGTLPIGKQSVEFYEGIIYKELYKLKELKLVSRGDNNIRKILTIVTDLLSNKIVELPNNQIVIDFKSAINDRKQEVMLPNVEVIIKKI